MSTAPNKGNKIIAYELPDFQGQCREFTSDVKNLRDVGFGDCISSLEVIGQPWIAYEDPDFGGWLREYEEGKHPNIELQDKISSLRLITDDLKNPEITLYENKKFQGQSKTFTMETNLKYDNFNDMASSHTVQRGAWILYEQSSKKGWRILARTGEDLEDYSTIPFRFNNNVSYIRPLRAGRPIVTSKVLWPQMKKENEICSLLEEIIGVNKSDFEQELTSTRSRDYESSVTYDFKFSDTTTIAAGAEITIQLIASVSTKISNSLTFERGKSETSTKKETGAQYTKVPPHTKMTVRVIRNECTIIVPVELTVEQNEKTTIEKGELRCEMGNIITTEYESAKV
ncbi:epidermal differentiation-specific protein-like [Rhinatrema bivittatum]|uniref:epidermal differentiation-specific protein-like n=1 Tax=Rhinatrema bivittatum TaxID=194408 RepID=UPI0011260CA7|nr:epidermal differentiation-specific protein-like [Rhinatrema bivittatum]XP_029444010.1 epidermal differentiation-specific protein-like [Rhinatrema bivittatum]